MAGQQDGFIDVLCLHQTVAVPPQLSDEGRYSVLMFFDTASVLLENQEHGGRRWGGRVEGEGGRSGMQPDREEGDGLDQEGRDRRSRKQICHDLSKAIAILLSDGDVLLEGDLADGKGNDGSIFDSRQSDNPISCRNNGRSSPVVDGTRILLTGKKAEGGAGDIDFGAEGEGDPEQRPSSLERPSSLGLNREADALSRDLQGELDGEQLEARLARECGIVNDLPGDGLETLPLSDVPSAHGVGGQSEEENVEEEEHATTRDKEQQQQQHVRPTSPSHSAAKSDDAEYSSGDESSVPPRVDLLLSPYRASTSTRRSTVPTEERQLPRKTIRIPHRGSRGSGTMTDETGVTTSRILPVTDSRIATDGRSDVEVESSTATGKSMDEQDRNPQDTLPGTVDRGKAVATAKYDDAQQSTPRNLRLSLDGYEDDFCDDEDESGSLVQPQEEGEGSAGKKSDATAGDNNNSHSKPRGVEHRSDLIRGGNGDSVATGFDDEASADGYASSTSEGVYSDTAAGGLEADLHGGGRSDGVGYAPDGHLDTSWGGSPDGGLGEGDVWGIRSPPRSSASNHRNLSSRNAGRRKVQYSDDYHPSVSEENDRRAG